MARFDVHRLARGGAPLGQPGTLVVDIQSAHLDYLETRIVVPMRLRSGVKPIEELHPTFHVEGDSYVLVTHSLGSIRRRELGRPIANLAAFRDQITRALDLLLTGF